MPNLDLMWQWSVAKCNEPDVGYSLAYREQQTVNGITYYDCSSFVYYALQAGRFPVEQYQGNDPFTTDEMDSVLRSLGFTKYASSDVPTDQWKKCDILWRRKKSAQSYNHTELVHSVGQAMGARGAESYTLPNQVAIHSSTSANWEYLYRYTGQESSEWIKGNRYLSQQEMENNAIIVRNFFNDRGYTLEAICGILGNMQQESTINPALWQNLDYGNVRLGFGLVQWTPSTKYTDWADAHGYAHDDGDWQLVWIHDETAPSGEWIPTSLYPMTWSEFIVSKQTPEYLASVYLKNFERAGNEQEQLRRQYARNWYEFLSGIQPVPPSPVPVKFFRRSFPLMYYLKPFDF